MGDLDKRVYCEGCNQYHDKCPEAEPVQPDIKALNDWKVEQYYEGWCITSAWKTESAGLDGDPHLVAVFDLREDAIKVCAQQAAIAEQDAKIERLEFSFRCHHLGMRTNPCLDCGADTKAMKVRLGAALGDGVTGDPRTWPPDDAAVKVN